MAGHSDRPFSGEGKAMFTAKITIREAEFHGLEALDLRRRLGLPDGDRLYIEGRFDPHAKAGEAFARKHAAEFGERATVCRTVQVGHLIPGDLVMRDAGHGLGNLYAQLNPDMPAARVLELWEAGE